MLFTMENKEIQESWDQALIQAAFNAGKEVR
jgi:hypothetical protein